MSKPSIEERLERVEKGLVALKEPLVALRDYGYAEPVELEDAIRAIEALEEERE